MHAAYADIAVVEGVMGLYDGEFSTATIASVLGVPVILVVDAYGMAESAGALVKGFASALMAGVIFNRVASESHFKRLKESVHNVPVLGFLPRDTDFGIPHRHLGLVVAEEAPLASAGIDKLADAVIEHIDLDLLLKTAERHGDTETRRHGAGKACSPSPIRHVAVSPRLRIPASPRPSAPVSTSLTFRAKIAVAYDKAFCFYYEDNLDLLRQTGAELVFFSPLSDPQIPADADAVYIGGGYPELYAKALSENSGMIASVNAWADSGRPLYAECGGLMYLSSGIHDLNSCFFRMSGVFPFETRMKKGRSHLGYREVLIEKDCIIGKKGERLRGHEFHYSEIMDNSPESLSAQHSNLQAPRPSRLPALPPSKVYSVRGRSGEELADEGYSFKKTLASYIHLHFAGNRSVAEYFITYIREN
jgi:cobyrinic acid a,c-diamide synthase